MERAALYDVRVLDIFTSSQYGVFNSYIFSLTLHLKILEHYTLNVVTVLVLLLLFVFLPAPSLMRI